MKRMQEVESNQYVLSLTLELQTVYMQDVIMLDQLI